MRQQSVSLRCGPLQSRFARQLPQRGSLYADLNFVLLFHTGTAHNRSVGAGFPRPPAAVSVSDRVQHGPSGTPAPTALFRVACRGDPCDRPFLPASDHVQQTGRRGRRPLQSGRKLGGEDVGAGVPDSPCAGTKKHAVILRSAATKDPVWLRCDFCSRDSSTRRGSE